jgi:hypothetical protein
MSDDIRLQTVVDFFWERHRRQNWDNAKSIAEFALGQMRGGTPRQKLDRVWLLVRGLSA